MENNVERVLAYTLAKEIEQEELESVSGGSFKITHDKLAIAESGKPQLDATWDM